MVCSLLSGPVAVCLAGFDIARYHDIGKSGMWLKVASVLIGSLLFAAVVRLTRASSHRDRKFFTVALWAPLLWAMGIILFALYIVHRLAYA